MYKLLRRILKDTVSYFPYVCSMFMYIFYGLHIWRYLKLLCLFIKALFFFPFEALDPRTVASFGRDWLYVPTQPPTSHSIFKISRRIWWKGESYGCVLDTSVNAHLLEIRLKQVGRLLCCLLLELRVERAATTRNGHSNRNYLTSRSILPRQQHSHFDRKSAAVAPCQRPDRLHLFF